MMPTRPARLGAVFVVTALAVWLLGDVIYLRLPPFPWTSSVGLLLLAVVEAYLARMVTLRLEGRPGTKPMRAIEAAPYVALAKATSLVGAVGAGISAGLASYAWQQRGSVRTAGDDATASAVAAVAGLLLVGAALLLERACLADRRRRGPDGSQPRDGASA